VNALSTIRDSTKSFLQRNPAKGAALYLARARACRLLGDVEAAAAAYQAALTFNDNLVESYVGLSELRMPGEGYLSWLARFQEALSPETYLEIGVATGQSLALARPPTRSIGIDPQPRVKVPLTAETTVFNETSDKFFGEGRLASLLAGRPLRLAFIDGKHEFAQSLRDFMHVEASCDKNSVVLMHDTVPLDEVTQRPIKQKEFFTGDVWKTVLCLKQYRPDLNIFTIATPMSGLTVITGLNPESRVLFTNYDAAIARFSDMPYSQLEHDMKNALNMVSNEWPVVEQRLRARGIIQR